uniref:ribosome maturation factor RimM n=1 Tax=Stappia sp. TaxID=1870903 RepID=UPI003BAB5C25
MSSDRILIARIGAPHGVRGEVRVKPYGDDPLSFTDYGPLETLDGKRRFEVISARVQKSVVVTRFKGVDDRNAAEALNGLDLYVERDALPELDDEDEFYHTDLLGLEAAAPSGERLGEIVALPDFGAGTLVEIRPGAGPTFYVAFTRECVPKIDLENGRVVVILPEETESPKEGEAEADGDQAEGGAEGSERA